MVTFFQSSLGKKYIMAITGLVLFGFVIGHMLGNLQIFLGPDQINAYAVLLKSKPALLWTARIGLLLTVVLHIISAIQLARMNRGARPAAYENYKAVAASYASRTMLMSGIIIFVFVVYHLLHFTVAIPEVNLLPKSPEFPHANFLELRDATGRPDVFQMMIRGFSSPLVSGFYVLGMALLCLHLSHGIGSMFQSVGLKSKRTGKFIDAFALVSAALIFVGNCSIPVAILLGYGR
jgi:succinate dehydrogenase / fumarate reductase cytochrome b subunit